MTFLLSASVPNPHQGLDRADTLRLLELAEQLKLELDLERIRRERAEFLLRVNYRKEERRSLAVAEARGTLLGSARLDHWQGRECRLGICSNKPVTRCRV
jgi:hypothetical protein